MNETRASRRRGAYVQFVPFILYHSIGRYGYQKFSTNRIRFQVFFHDYRLIQRDMFKAEVTFADILTCASVMRVIRSCIRGTCKGPVINYFKAKHTYESNFLYYFVIQFYVYLYIRHYYPRPFAISSENYQFHCCKNAPATMRNMIRGDFKATLSISASRPLRTLLTLSDESESSLPNFLNQR